MVIQSALGPGLFTGLFADPASSPSPLASERRDGFTFGVFADSSFIRLLLAVTSKKLLGESRRSLFQSPEISPFANDVQSCFVLCVGAYIHR